MDLDQARRKFETVKGPYEKALADLNAAEEAEGNRLILDTVVLMPDKDKVFIIPQTGDQVPSFGKDELPRLIRFIKIQASKMGYKVD
jgi:hypothetical protein